MGWKESLLEHFPNAADGQRLTVEIVDALAQNHHFTPKNTLFGYSTCPDEINRNVTRFRFYYGEQNFPLGGLTGYPFRGKTGFSAFSHHVPDNGNIVVLYGPHVGISANGELGRILRENQSHESTACGAAISFLNKYVEAKKAGKEYQPAEDPLDMEQCAIEKMMLPYAEQIAGSKNQIKELVEVNYNLIDQAIIRIIHELKHHFKGKVALLGGIMVNTQEHGYFDLRKFEVHHGKVETNLMPEISLESLIMG